MIKNRNQLKNKLKENNINIELYLGNEIFITNDIVELLIYYPVGTYSKLNEYKQSVLYTMKLLKGIRRVIDPMPTIIDDDKKAYMTSFSYRRIKKKEGA